MAKGMYVGISGKARKIKKGYVGIGGKARKIKKAYVGIGGKARPFWTGGQVEYYGSATSLDETVFGLAGASVGNYALFAGGTYNGSRCCATVNAYNNYLVKSITYNLDDGKAFFAGIRAGEKAFFAGGWAYLNSGHTYFNTVDVYNSSLTVTRASGLSDKKEKLGAANAGNYTLFAGGSNLNGYLYSVDAYNKELVKSKPTDINASAEMGATVGNYALFTNEFCTVTAYNGNLVQSIPMKLSVDRSSTAGASLKSYALFAGGYKSRVYQTVVDAYNENLTRSTATPLSTGRFYMPTATTKDVAIFAGGGNGNNIVMDDVDVYDNNLIRTTTQRLSTPKGMLAGASVGKYILFAGGRYGSTFYNTVDAYVV